MHNFLKNALTTLPDYVITGYADAAADTDQQFLAVDIRGLIVCALKAVPGIVRIDRHCQKIACFNDPDFDVGAG